MSHRNISITLPEGLLARVDALAKAETRSRSQQIAHLLGVAMPKPVWKNTWTNRLQFDNREATPEDADALVAHLAGLGFSLAVCREMFVGPLPILELTGSADAIEAALPHIALWVSEADNPED